MIMKLTSKQYAEQAKMSLEKYIQTGNLERLKEASLRVKQAEVEEVMVRRMVEMVNRK